MGTHARARISEIERIIVFPFPHIPLMLNLAPSMTRPRRKGGGQQMPTSVSRNWIPFFPLVWIFREDEKGGNWSARSWVHLAEEALAPNYVDFFALVEKSQVTFLSFLQAFRKNQGFCLLFQSLSLTASCVDEIRLLKTHLLFFHRIASLISVFRSSQFNLTIHVDQSE